MSKPTYPILGYDVGGTKVAVCVADSAGRVLASDRLASGPARSYEEVLPEMVALGQKLIRDAGIDPAEVRACGVCAPGPLDMAEGLLLKSPNMVWDRAPIRDDLKARLGMPVFLGNDANAGVLAERYFGTARDCQDVIYLTMSTGVGGGVISGGHLLEGATGIGAELGHAVLEPNGPLCGCGMRGCLEAYCGGRNVAMRLRELLIDRPGHPIMQLPEVGGNPDNLNYETLRAGVKREIPLALELWDEICLRLAQGMGIHMMTFNPQMVVLGTLAYYSGDLLLEPVRRHLRRFCWPEMHQSCRVEVTSLGSKIGELAGISLALYGLA